MSTATFWEARSAGQYPPLPIQVCKDTLKQQPLTFVAPETGFFGGQFIHIPGRDDFGMIQVHYCALYSSYYYIVIITLIITLLLWLLYCYYINICIAGDCPEPCPCKCPLVEASVPCNLPSHQCATSEWAGCWGLCLLPVLPPRQLQKIGEIKQKHAPKR